MARFSEVIPAAGRYVNAADKAMLAADPTAEKADERAEDATGPVALRLIDARYQPRAMFGPRWLVGVRTLSQPVEDIAIDFAAATKDGSPIEARNIMFGELRDRLDAGEAFDPVVLVRVPGTRGGNPFWTFEDAPAALVAKPVAPVWLDDDDDDETPDDIAPVNRPRLARSKATARK